MIRVRIKQQLEQILKRRLPAEGEDGRPLNFTVGAPPGSVVSDLATNAAMAAAKRLGLSSQTLARELREELQGSAWCERAEIAGPGFLNLWVRDSALIDELREVLLIGPGYGSAPADSQSSLLIEFVSANPTGPLHVGHGRGAALGDCLARIFRFLGHKVTTEYYLNDVGNQIEMLGRSVAARRAELEGRGGPFPENGYRGDYVVDIARKAIQERVPEGEFGRFAVREILAGIETDIKDFRVHFDHWFRESSLYESGLVEKCFQFLREKGTLYESEGALWFASSRFLDDKDRVLKRSDERPTYFASDIAYHFKKCEEGYDRLINIWGTDHHGYVPRLRSVMMALGQDEKKLVILLYQLVSLLRDGKPVSMSTRSGEFDTLRQLLTEVGPDACRFFFAMRAPETHLEFDLELAKKQAPENPVYYVQYVHARICSIFREAGKSGPPRIAPELPPGKAALEKEERTLILELSRFPEIGRLCAQALSPHHLTTYLLELARAFHSFYENHRVLSDDPGITRWRLSLLDGVRRVVRQGLDLLGVSSPEQL
jgi:arginyl-tRNA synthetase